MGMENHEGYANQAFRAETHEASPVAKKFDILKEKFNSLKLTEVIGDKDRAKIGEKSRDFFDTFSRGYRSVEHMEEIAGDVNKTETQKQAAMDDLDLLGKVVYESVREDEKFSRFIGEGSANKIDENLPEEFRGIGKVVLTNVFEEGPVLNALKELDENRAELSRMPEGATREKLTRGMVNKTIRKLVNMKDLTPGQKHDRQMSLGYLGAELDSEIVVSGGKEKKGFVQSAETSPYDQYELMKIEEAKRQVFIDNKGRKDW